MPTKDIRLKQFGRNPLLPRIDDLMTRRSRTDLLIVPPLDRITKDDTHDRIVVLRASGEREA
jgi:hypothetical protein